MTCSCKILDISILSPAAPALVPRRTVPKRPNIDLVATEISTMPGPETRAVSSERDNIDFKKEFSNLKSSIDKLSSKVDNKLKELDKSLCAKFDTKVKEIRDSFDLEVGQLVSRLERLEDKVIDRASDPYDPEVTICASDVPFEENEDIVTKVIKLVHEDLGLVNVTVVRAIRLTSRSNRPGIVKFELKSREEKIQVLRNKRRLMDNADGTRRQHRIYFSGAKTHTERLMDINFRELLKMVPNGQQYRMAGNGRIIKKQGRNTTDTSQDNMAENLN